jgi:hypothetical protein
MVTLQHQFENPVVHHPDPFGRDGAGGSREQDPFLETGRSQRRRDHYRHHPK